MTDPNELQTLLHGYTGSECLYRHPFGKGCTYTEGVKAFAENAGGGAYWLLDIIMTEPVLVDSMRAEGIIFVTLHVQSGRAWITAQRDTGEPQIFNRKVDWTDCPDGDWRFYFCNDVLMVPSEY